MKYLVMGAGGTGGSIAAYMSRVGMDVTLIARGPHLHEIKYHGLNVKSTEQKQFNVRVKVCEEQDYAETPDVIFVCVKGYQIESVLPFLRNISNKDTVIIPVLNGFGIADRMAVQIPNAKLIGGLIYITANKQAPGTVQLHGDIFRIFFGTKDGKTDDPVLMQVAADLKESGIDGVYSPEIEKEILKKFSLVSPWAACGVQFNITASEIQKPGYIRNFYKKLVAEVESLGKADGLTMDVDEDLVERNLAIIDAVAPTAKTSLQRDIEAGKPSEINNMILDVVRRADMLGVEVPTYKRVVENPIRDMLMR